MIFKFLNVNFCKNSFRFSPSRYRQFARKSTAAITARILISDYIAIADLVELACKTT